MKKTLSLVCVIGSLTFVVLMASAYAAPEAKNPAGDEPQLMAKDLTALPLSGDVRNGIRIIDVKAFRYGFDPDPMVVNQGDKVQLDVTSTDVAHGLAIKEYNINLNVPGGETKSIVFTAGDKGVFNVACSVFCGPGHKEMHAKFIVK
jgi:cytochrome c oxidase subunit 2